MRDKAIPDYTSFFLTRRYILQGGQYVKRIELKPERSMKLLAVLSIAIAKIKQVILHQMFIRGQVSVIRLLIHF